MIGWDDIVLDIDLAIWTVGSIISIVMAVRTLQMLQLAKVSRSLCTIIIWLIIVSSVATILFTAFFLILSQNRATYALVTMSVADATQITA